MTAKKSGTGAFLDRIAPPEGVLLLILAMIVGCATGLAAVFFIRLIDFIQQASYTSFSSLLPHLGFWAYILIPVIGALVAGPIISLFASEAKGHGVPEVMQALVLHGGRIRPRVAVAKIIASAFCIGTGGSAGREGPIVQVGSTLGSSVGQILRLSDERIKNLVACGAAAGIAATFNAPIAGVAFAIEVLMCELQVRMFGNVVISAVFASIVSQIFLGSAPAFTLPNYTMPSPWAIFFYIVLGLIAALVGIMFIRMLSSFEDLFDNWNFPQMLKPAVGALFLGLLGFGYVYSNGVAQTTGTEHLSPNSLIENLPHMYGSGFGFIEATLQGNFNITLLALLILLKPLATSFTLGSGNSGGVFAPSLFLGAMLGGVFGYLVNSWFPTIAGHPGAYALVGMAAVFSATARAPLTAMLIVFEMSNDYHLILPLMVAGVTACYFAQWLHSESIYTLKLAKRGVRFAHGCDMDIMQGVRVDEVMREAPVTVGKDMSLSRLFARFQETNLLGFPVVDKIGRLCGIVTLQDVEKVLHDDALIIKDMTVSDVAVSELVTAHPDEPIWTAIQKMSPRDLARLPVVDRDGSGRLLGLISRSDILRAYDVGIIRKQRGQLIEDRVRLRQSKESDFDEFVLAKSDHGIGRQLKDLDLPEDVTIVAIERSGTTIIPRGGTIFSEGDVVTVFGMCPSLVEAKKIFKVTNDSS